MSKFVNVQHYVNTTGHSCMHCSRPATTKAVRVNWMRVNVWYCEHHAELIIEQGATKKPDPFAGIVDVPYNEGKRA